MIYTLIISLIEKPFHLFSPQSFFISNSVRVHRKYICEHLNLYVPGVGLLTPCSVLYTMIVPGGGFLLPSSCVPGRGGGVGGDGYG